MGSTPYLTVFSMSGILFFRLAFCRTSCCSIILYFWWSSVKAPIRTSVVSSFVFMNVSTSSMKRTVGMPRGLALFVSSARMSASCEDKSRREWRRGRAAAVAVVVVVEAATSAVPFDGLPGGG